MHKPSVSQLVYKTLFPRPRSSDPNSLSLHITRNLVPEVRIETANFYGALDCIEAQYPGLDYTYPPHRRRLSRFPFHRRLFKVFDELRLTDNEILSLCQWEGTKSAKDKYEKDAGRPIRDTTLDGIECGIPDDMKSTARFNEEDDWRKAELQAAGRDVPREAEVSDEDETDTSVGVQLNQQLRAAAAARARGEPAVFDEEWEEWMKDILERNDMSVEAVLNIIREGRPFPLHPTTTSVSRSDSTISTGHVQAYTPGRGSTAANISGLQSSLHGFQQSTAQLASDPPAVPMALSARPPTEAAR